MDYLTQYQPSSKGGTHSLPQKYKLAAIGPQNNYVKQTHLIKVPHYVS